MPFSLSNLFKSKKNETTFEALHKIDFKGGTKYAENATNTVYLDVEELGGFPFIKTIIIGELSINIKRIGCTLTFFFDNQNTLLLHSDNTTIESSKIKNTPLSYTEIDFEIQDTELKQLKSEKVLEIQYQLNKKAIRLKTI
jgi:hypothetical protein